MYTHLLLVTNSSDLQTVVSYLDHVANISTSQHNILWDNIQDVLNAIRLTKRL